MFFKGTSLYEAVQADVRTIGGVYTVAFLTVLALFAVGNLLLKYKRSALPRDTRAHVAVVVVAFGLVVSALVGNALLSPEVVKVVLDLLFCDFIYRRHYVGAFSRFHS